jgi:hypothetical protein
MSVLLRLFESLMDVDVRTESGSSNGYGKVVGSTQKVRKKAQAAVDSELFASSSNKVGSSSSSSSSSSSGGGKSKTPRGVRNVGGDDLIVECGLRRRLTVGQVALGLRVLDMLPETEEEAKAEMGATSSSDNGDGGDAAVAAAPFSVAGRQGRGSRAGGGGGRGGGGGGVTVLPRGVIHAYAKHFVMKWRRGGRSFGLGGEVGRAWSVKHKQPKREATMSFSAFAAGVRCHLRRTYVGPSVEDLALFGSAGASLYSGGSAKASVLHTHEKEERALEAFLGRQSLGAVGHGREARARAEAHQETHAQDTAIQLQEARAQVKKLEGELGEAQASVQRLLVNDVNPTAFWRNGLEEGGQEGGNGGGGGEEGVGQQEEVRQGGLKRSNSSVATANLNLALDRSRRAQQSVAAAEAEALRSADRALEAREHAARAVGAHQAAASSANGSSTEVLESTRANAEAREDAAEDAEKEATEAEKRLGFAQRALVAAQAAEAEAPLKVAVEGLEVRLSEERKLASKEQTMLASRAKTLEQRCVSLTALLDEERLRKWAVVEEQDTMLGLALAQVARVHNCRKQLASLLDPLNEDRNNSLLLERLLLPSPQEEDEGGGGGEGTGTRSLYLPPLEGFDSKHHDRALASFGVVSSTMQQVADLKLELEACRIERKQAKQCVRVAAERNSDAKKKAVQALAAQGGHGREVAEHERHATKLAVAEGVVAEARLEKLEERVEAISRVSSTFLFFRE